jgi:hypothetical protein
MIGNCDELALEPLDAEAVVTPMTKNSTMTGIVAVSARLVSAATRPPTMPPPSAATPNIDMIDNSVRPVAEFVIVSNEGIKTANTAATRKRITTEASNITTDEAISLPHA